MFNIKSFHYSNCKFILQYENHEKKSNIDKKLSITMLILLNLQKKINHHGDNIKFTHLYNLTKTKTAHVSRNLTFN